MMTVCDLRPSISDCVRQVPRAGEARMDAARQRERHTIRNALQTLQDIVGDRVTILRRCHRTLTWPVYLSVCTP